MRPLVVARSVPALVRWTLRLTSVENGNKNDSHDEFYHRPDYRHPSKTRRHQAQQQQQLKPGMRRWMMGTRRLLLPPHDQKSSASPLIANPHTYACARGRHKHTHAHKHFVVDTNLGIARIGRD